MVWFGIGILVFAWQCKETSIFYLKIWINEANLDQNNNGSILKW